MTTLVESHYQQDIETQSQVGRAVQGDRVKICYSLVRGFESLT